MKAAASQPFSSMEIVADCFTLETNKLFSFDNGEKSAEEVKTSSTPRAFIESFRSKSLEKLNFGISKVTWP